MPKSTKSAPNSNLLKKLGIIAGLTLLWLGLTFLYISTFESFSIIPYNHSGAIDQYHNKPLLAGEKITGEFTARENNLGIIAIRFQLRSRIPYAQEDNLIFRLKEKGDEEWYYTGEYKSGLTYDVPFLPFGFPIIENSKDKEYIFELESLKGNPRNALIVDRQYPRLQSKYVVDLGAIKSDPMALAEYFKQKYIDSFDNPTVLFSSIIYALPLLFYLAWIAGLINRLLRPFSMQINWLEKKLVMLKNRESPIVFSAITLAFIIYDIFVIQLTNDMVYIVIIALWLSLFRIFKLEDRITFVVGLSFLLFTAISNTAMLEAVAEKSAAWAFMFLLAGTIQLAKGLKVKNE